MVIGRPFGLASLLHPRHTRRDLARGSNVPKNLRTRPALAGLAIIAFAISACGGSAASTAPSRPRRLPRRQPPRLAPAASGAAALTGHIQLPDKGFGLTLPDGWSSVPLDPADMQSVIDGLPEGSDMRTLLEGQVGSSALQAIAFWAFDFDAANAASGVQRNVNIITQPASSMDLSVVESAVKAQLGTISGVGSINSEMVTIPAGQALKLDYTLGVPGANGATTDVHTIQYYIQLPTATLIASFTSEPGATDAQTDIDAIVQSIEAVS